MNSVNPDIDIRAVDRIVEAALDEDIGYCDLTTRPSSVRTAGPWVISSPSSGIICGLVVAQRVFRMIDEGVVFEPLVSDGDAVSKGDVFAQ